MNILCMTYIQPILNSLVYFNILNYIIVNYNNMVIELENNKPTYKLLYIEEVGNI